METVRPVDAEFARQLPKIELHAHLSGSISRKCLHDIWQRRKDTDSELKLTDPLVVMPINKVDYDVKTFFPLFSDYIYQLCSDEESIRYSTTNVLQHFKDDGVIYLELRTTPRSTRYTKISKSDYVSIVLDCIDNFGKDSMSTYLILSIDRRSSALEAMEVVDLAIEYKSRGVIAVDLCGDPSKGDISMYREAFLKARNHGLKLTLHFAEIPDSPPKELETLLSFEPERIGHVIHTSDSLKREIIARRLGLELCLSCNVHAKLTSGGFRNHHFGFWRDTGCPVILCTDDVGIFCSPLSNEYLLAAENFNLGRSDLLDVCSKAIEAVFGGDFEKQRLQKSLSAFRASLGL